jgi:DNA modification methylase
MLKVVETLPFFKKELDIWPLSSAGVSVAGMHSLHYLLQGSSSLSLGRGLTPEIASYFINKYSKKDEVVFDPFCGLGSAVLEAALGGRIAVASDDDPLLLRIARSKVQPADLAEVTLFLQQAELGRPADVSEFKTYFSPFYDLATYREILNLRSFLFKSAQQSQARVARFVELLSLSLLHGHSAGYFSTYSFPQISLSPLEQKELNLKRAQTPDYRPVVPRLIKKAASVLRDSIPSSLVRSGALASFHLKEQGKDFSFIPSSSVSLVITALPLPGDRDNAQSMWLKYWFSGFKPPAPSKISSMEERLSEWLENTEILLHDLFRVCRPGARAVFELRDLQHKKSVIPLDQLLLDSLQKNGSGWEAEYLICRPERYLALDGKKRSSAAEGSLARKALVFKRR